MSDMTKQQLMERRTAVQAEQQELRRQLGEWREHLTKLGEVRRQALKQYDTGIDSALAEANAALDGILATETAITRAERQQLEFGPRIDALNKEIEAAGHRERLHELLELRRDEVESFNEYEQSAQQFFVAYHAFQNARTLRKSLATSLHNAAVANGLPNVEGGDFTAPGKHEFDLWLAEAPQRVADRIERDFAKGRAQIKPV